MMANATVTDSKSRILLALFLGATACWLMMSNASAHAAYESSTPGFADVLEQSPSEISIRFTQELFRREGANGLVLTHADSGNEVRLGEPEIDNDDRHVMAVSVEDALSPGRYIVAWTNLSAEDGDTDSGSYPFYVGRSPSPTEVEADRRIAAELLIVYPGDATADPDEQESTTQRAPTVVRSPSADGARLGVGPIVWLVVGIGAALVLTGSLGFHLGRRRRGG